MARQELSLEELSALGQDYAASSNSRHLCKEIYSRFATLGFGLYQRDAPLFDTTLSGALSRLKVAVRPWLVLLEKNVLRTPQCREALVNGVFETLGVQVGLLTLAKERCSITWQDLRVPLCLVAFDAEDELFFAILRLDCHGNQVSLYSPVCDNLSSFLLDGNRRVGQQNMQIATTTQVVELKFDDQMVVVRLPAISESALVQRCSICNCSLCSLPPLEQPNHVSECSAKQKNELDAQAKATLLRIDTRLQARNLERNSVPGDGYCYLRALLLAQGKNTDQGAVISLFLEIWSFAKRERFLSSLLTLREREELLKLEKPEECLAGVSFSASISRESCFESFWNIVSCWAAPTIRRDIYLVSNEAMTCTLFPKAALHRHTTVPLAAVSSALSTQDAVALLHLTLPALHIEWLSLQRPKSPVGQYDEAPASPMTGTEPTSATHPSTSAGDQLSVLLSGKTLTLPQSSLIGWWRSFNGVLREFSSRTGKLVWYSRLTADTWLQHRSGWSAPSELRTANGVSAVSVVRVRW